MAFPAAGSLGWVGNGSRAAPAPLTCGHWEFREQEPSWNSGMSIMEGNGVGAAPAQD